MVLGLQHQMIVLVRCFGIDPPAPAHAEMEHHRMVTVGMEDAVFRAARQGRDGRPGQRLHQIGREGAPHVGPVHRTLVIRSPSRNLASPRTVVSTSGSSGI